MSRGKDEFYIKVSDLQLITRKKKSALLAIAENLKDMLGNLNTIGKYSIGWR